MANLFFYRCRCTRRLLFLQHLLLCAVVLLIDGTTIECARIIVVPGNETDRLALLAFKGGITDDPLGAFSSWNNDSSSTPSRHFCRWKGITCSRRHQRVTVLSLQAQKLAGSLSPYLGNLTFLRELNLGDNFLRGEIPPQLGNLRRMRILNLTTNSLGGEIPGNLSNCRELRHLDLGTNALVGNIPSELIATTLSKLSELFLLVNNLTGVIPPSIGNLSSLTSLALGRNALEGNIPEEIGLISGLKFLQIAENQLSGTIPRSLYNLSSLHFISVAANHQLEGTLPPNLGLTLPKLETLYVADNRLSGPIPASLANASGLENLDFAYNNFTGSVPADLGRLGGLLWLNFESNQLGIPVGEVGSFNGGDLSLFLTSLTNCTHLEVLDIDSNSFDGHELPSSVANLSSQLSMLIMGGNRLRGRIPEGIGNNLASLTVLRLERNLLSGGIPASIGKLRNLQLLSLFGNELWGGQIPSSLGKLTRLTELYLQGNGLRGSLPRSLENCRSLQYLDVSENKLQGMIPGQVVGIPSLSIALDLSHNSLVGALPPEVGNLKNLGKLDVSENRLSGEIPSALGDCQSLEYLRMGGNFFGGTIPSSLRNLEGIQDLDLSRNNLSGQIPAYLGKLRSMRYLNLSFNNFNGQVPTEGVFENASAISILGNSKLCGGVSELHLPSCSIQTSKKAGGRTRRLRIIIPIVCVVSGLILLTCLFATLFWLRRLRKKPSHTPSLDDRHVKVVSYRELLKATDGFSSDNLVGVGSYGSVYRGVLLDDKGNETVVVAVKVLNLQHQGASNSFMAECEVLRNIRHRNLVKILTSCSSVDFNGNEFKALIYEFMPNGSIERWLHPEAAAADEQHSTSKKLNIIERLNIAIDVASALDYIHHQCHVPIVHCDLKPSNVLLDDDMIAHVGDFGLARILSDDINPQIQTKSIRVKGSIGYVPPEYGMGASVSTQGDVYSYGVLLLEMFTGMRPTNSTFEDGLNLHNFAKMALPDRVMEIGDPQMLIEEAGKVIETTKGHNNNNDMRSRINECLVSVISVGLSCSTETPKERMDMKEVLVQMCAIRDTFLGVGIHKKQNRGEY